jgi:hypothetical protein
MFASPDVLGEDIALAGQNEVSPGAGRCLLEGSFPSLPL